jgi:5-deoxy-glucuronate isomerase
VTGVPRAADPVAGPFTLEVTPETADWGYSSLRVATLAAGGAVSWHTGQDETIVLPLSGSCVVSCLDADPGADPVRREFVLTGRRGVFTRVTDFAYVPRDAEVTVSSRDGGRFALPAARARRRLPARYGAAGDVSVELRGAGTSSRQVNNFCLPGVFDADRLIAVEVLTPGGNTSSFPPHKHDQARDGESVLEEIYYFEVADGPGGTPGTAYQRVSTSDPKRAIDICAEVRTGDTVLIPHGWHGPSMATPGYDLYYLNVMAGPGDERAWRICDHPDHAWVRGTWAGQPIDPRLPLTGTEELAGTQEQA